MSWLVILALAAIAFAAAVFALRLPREGYTLFGAAMLFGLAGYALEGSPGQAGAPKPAAEEVAQTGEIVVTARRELFDPALLPSRFVVTADAFARRGDFQSAAQFLRNAVEENPNDTEAWVALGNALVEHSDGRLTPAAMLAYGRAEQSDPDSPAAGYFVGLGLLRAGQVGEAREIWVQLVNSAPEGADWVPIIAGRIQRLDALVEATSAQGAAQ